MDAFQEFRTQSSSANAYDAFTEFRPNHLTTGDGFSEFRATSQSTGVDAYPEFRPLDMNAAPAEPFEEFRAKMFATGADEFAEFRSQPTTTSASTSTLLSKPRQLMRRFLRLAPGPIQYARAAPVIEEAPHDELHVTLPLPGAHAEDVHVTLHAAELLVSNEATHATRTITLPSAVLPDASAAFKDGKLSVTLHKCASPLDSDMHSIMVR